MKESGLTESRLTAAAPSKPTVTGQSTGKTDSKDDRVRIVNKIEKAGKKLQLVDLLGRRERWRMMRENTTHVTVLNSVDTLL